MIIFFSFHSARSYLSQKNHALWMFSMFLDVRLAALAAPCRRSPQNEGITAVAVDPCGLRRPTHQLVRVWSDWLPTDVQLNAANDGRPSAAIKCEFAQSRPPPTTGRADIRSFTLWPASTRSPETNRRPTFQRSTKSSHFIQHT